MIHPTAPDAALLPRVGEFPVPLSAWLTGTFLPLWAERARGAGQPGYVEAVRRDGSPLPSSQRSTLVTARLVYSFSLGHALAPDGPCLETAAHGLRFLLGACRRQDGRFSHLATTDGEACGTEADLYDLAFVLLALAGHAGASGRWDLLGLAEEIAIDLDTRLAHPDGGYRDPAGDTPLRRQFPHMHLFEACQLLSRLAPGTGWERRCEAILDIVERHLIAGDGSIAEWYEPDWRPARAALGSLREIGHQFEWAWLLYRHAWSAGSTRAAQIGDRLYRFGIAAAGLHDGLPHEPLPNAIDALLAPVGPGRPLWALTELLRASLAAEIADRDPGAGELADAAARRLFERYLDPRSGLWINETDSAGHPLSDEIPLRVLYHLVPALAGYSREREGTLGTGSPLFDRYAVLNI